MQNVAVQRFTGIRATGHNGTQRILRPCLARDLGYPARGNRPIRSTETDMNNTLAAAGTVNGGATATVAAIEAEPERTMYHYAITIGYPLFLLADKGNRPFRQYRVFSHSKRPAFTGLPGSAGWNLT